MGLISASSLGQPIIKINIISKSLLNVPIKGRFCSNMAPALTTELSAEHRSLSNDLKNCPKLDSDTLSSPVLQGGDIVEGINIKQSTSSETSSEVKVSSDLPSSQPLSNSDEEAALKAEAEEVLGHNVDEILQVLESMEAGGKCGGSVAAGEESMLNLLGSELELLAAGDMCGSQESEPCSSPTPKVDIALTEERLAETNERQHVLQRRCERLMRRVSKMQARGTARHSAHQLQELVTSARALLKARNASHRSHAASQQQATREQLLDQDYVKNMSSAALLSLVRKMSNASSTAIPSVGQGLAQALSPDQATALRDGSGALSFRLGHSEAAYDSDVTASSSGGESCDEAAGFNLNNTGTLPICKRASWRYAKERSSVVSRWTWLQANISDLEYRIRQYTEVQRQLRTNKGAVRLLDPPASSKAQLRPGGESMWMNGCHSQMAVTSNEFGQHEENDEVAARTRPYDASVFRKRKLIIPGVVVPTSVKRFFQANNQPPCCRDAIIPCLLCFTRRAAIASGNQFGSQLVTNSTKESCRERAARLDPAIHPILSGPSDVSRSIHMANHLRQPSWQQTQLRQRGLARLGLGLKRSKSASLSSGPVSDLLATPTPRRKYNTYKKNNNNANALSAKIRRKAKARKRHKGRPSTDGVVESLDRYKKNRRLQRNSIGDLSRSVLDKSDYSTPVPSPGMGPRKKRENSYDIDNIVIPYSMAALTRVERLEYKEILTPKWRVVEVEPESRPSLAKSSSLGSSKNGVVKSSTGSAPQSPNSDVEDVSDEAVLARHEALELDERRKFRCPPSNSVRSMRGRRTDSRAESSGANTPDPMSPIGVSEVGDSPMASPRATPLPTAMFLEDPQAGGSKPPVFTSKPPNLRRRTISSQRTASPEPSTLAETVPPFELRTFPLSEDTYQRLISANSHLVNSRSQPPILRAPSPPPSPCGTDSTESALPEDDMDPEWTIDSEMPPSPSAPPHSASAANVSTRSTLRKTL